jgi:hypothetical protein
MRPDGKGAEGGSWADERSKIPIQARLSAPKSERYLSTLKTGAAFSFNFPKN